MVLEIKINTFKKILVLTAFTLILLVLLISFMNKNSNATINDNQTISMGAVSLNVKNLELVKSFYNELVGLEVIKEDGEFVELGKQKKSVIKLYKDEDFNEAKSTDAGLYHSAIVFSTRTELAKTIEKILSNRPDLYQGSSDHLVSEAFYFADPEGNGVELYFDKPRADWQFDQNGKPIMGGTYINESTYIRRYKNEYVNKSKVNMGHVHLKVGNIATAKKFYEEILYFDVIMESSQALFVSRDNYHHHIGMNTWESLGASTREPKKYGLKSFEILFHNKDEFSRVVESINKSGAEYKEVEGGIDVKDPWGNLVVLVSK